jgi:hypothetical protein
MRCDRCQGKGTIWRGEDGASFNMVQQPCEDCQGSGIAYCCGDAGVNPPNTHLDALQERIRRLEIAMGLDMQWPFKGSDGLYDPIDIHNDKDEGC